MSIKNNGIHLVIIACCFIWSGCLQKEGNKEIVNKGTFIENIYNEREKSTQMSIREVENEAGYHLVEIVNHGNNDTLSMKILLINQSHFQDWTLLSKEITIGNQKYTINKYLYDLLDMDDEASSYFIIENNNRLIHLREENWASTKSFLISKLEREILDSVMNDPYFYTLNYTDSKLPTDTFAVINVNDEVSEPCKVLDSINLIDYDKESIVILYRKLLATSNDDCPLKLVDELHDNRYKYSHLIDTLAYQVDGYVLQYFCDLFPNKCKER